MTISSSFRSAGIGRSGTFCLVDCCLVLIDKEGENRVSVQEVLLELRNYRMGLIQTHDQLTFSYEAIIEGMKRMNNDVSCSECSVSEQSMLIALLSCRHSTSWTIWKLQLAATMTRMFARRRHYRHGQRPTIRCFGLCPLHRQIWRTPPSRAIQLRRMYQTFLMMSRPIRPTVIPMRMRRRRSSSSETSTPIRLYHRFRMEH